MRRDKMDELDAWKNRINRKPLIVRGARQVGKTWLIKEFAKTNFNNYVYVNFEESEHLQDVFASDFDVNRILKVLEIHSKSRIIEGETLIIFDEIQEAPKGLTSLKYFNENAPGYHIIAAGSLLGVSLHQHVSFPVGKVDFIDLQPMSFNEFLLAIGENGLNDLVKSKDWETLSVFKNKLNDLLKYYLFIGGMPEAVDIFIQTGDLDQVRFVQNRILKSYQGDFSKHAPYEIIPRILMVWQSLVAQLSRENKKFVYGIMKEGARAKDFELAIQWLCDAGLMYKVFRVSKPELPLNAFQDLSAFKLFLHDVGLLVAMTGLDAKSIIEGNSLFLQFHGALAEQYVFQQLNNQDDRYIGYWTNDRSTSEIDFLIQTNGKVIPVEVKSGENLRSKSFKQFCEKFQPDQAIRASMSDYKEEMWMTNIPLWSVGIL